MGSNILLNFVQVKNLSLSANQERQTSSNTYWIKQLPELWVAISTPRHGIKRDNYDRREIAEIRIPILAYTFLKQNQYSQFINIDSYCRSHLFRSHFDKTSTNNFVYRVLLSKPYVKILSECWSNNRFQVLRFIKSLDSHISGGDMLSFSLMQSSKDFVHRSNFLEQKVAQKNSLKFDYNLQDCCCCYHRQVKEAIFKASFQNMYSKSSYPSRKKYLTQKRIITIWQSQLIHPIYATGHFLYPLNFHCVQIICFTTDIKTGFLL